MPLWLDAQEAGLPMRLPACHHAFVLEGEPAGGLALRVRRGHPERAGGWRPVYHPSDTWELWRDGGGRYLFVAPVASYPLRHVIVDAIFRTGEVVGEFAAGEDGASTYPLEDVEHVLYANWLAESGDVMLHAAGVAVAGAGYCFAGAAGAGKSTLAAHLAQDRAVTVLGEDQVILRYLDGQFWIYGTPWHLNPAMCSPHGVPLRKVFFLDWRAERPLTPVSPLDGVTRLLQSGFIPYYRPEAVSAILDRLALLGESVPFHTLAHRLGSEALPVIVGA